MVICDIVLWYLPNISAFAVVQKSPVVGHGQRGTVGHCDYFTSLRTFDNTAEIHHIRGEAEVGKVDLSMQFNHLLLGMFPVMYFKVLEKYDRGMVSTLNKDSI